jgi:hypothetical protein
MSLDHKCVLRKITDSAVTPRADGGHSRPADGLARERDTVRVEGGKPWKEAVGGLFILEADDLDAAIAVAARVPAARYGGAVEIRPSEVYW